MDDILEVTSLLINEFHGLLSMLTRYIGFGDHEEEYKVIFEIFYQAAHREPLLSTNLHKDARLLGVLQYARKFLDHVSEVIYEHNADIHALAQEMLRRAYMVLAEVPESNPRYVIICDGMSVADAIYIAYRLRKEYKEYMELFITPLINPGGITETYKFILEPHSYFQSTSLTLKDIARKIAEKVHAKDAIVFRGYDETIHRLRNVHATDIVDEMYKLTSRLYSKIIQLKNGFSGVVMVLSDHGYDVIERGMGLYEMKHFWRPHFLSVIASLLIV